LSGIWNFDLKYSLGLIGLPGFQGERLTISEAVGKQLGLKLEKKKRPAQVIIIDHIEQTPTPD
jgi:uncharacterized protein (TIGR03435 family)